MRSLACESSQNQSLAVSICCILGAGYSHVAGAPLTRDLFATHDVAVSSEAARRRFQTVWDHYDTWLAENPSRNPEEYLADLLEYGQAASWTVNERYVLRGSDLVETPAIETLGPTFSFPDSPVPTRVIPPFKWAMQLLGATLASPLHTDTTITNFRYVAPTYSYPALLITTSSEPKASAGHLVGA